MRLINSMGRNFSVGDWKSLLDVISYIDSLDYRQSDFEFWIVTYILFVVPVNSPSPTHSHIHAQKLSLGVNVSISMIERIG